MQKQSPLLRLWELGSDCHSGLLRAILSAFIGVLCGMIPYFAAAQILIGLIQGERDTGFYLTWCIAALAGYLLRAILYAFALSMSHRATFSILKNIRERLLAKLPKMPLGTVVDASSGQLKQVIVDQVESMERPLAHLLPEMTSNLLVPVCIFIYLFVLDWRMALLSLVSIPVGMAFMMVVMKDYGKQYEGSVKVTQAMNSTIVEYIGGIEVIKAFNQGKHSYAKLSERVLANASYFYHWMKSCQLPVSISKALAPTTMITILPVGWLMYVNGSLRLETFLITIILSLGIAGPLLAAMDFVDSLAKVGTIVGEVDSILNGEEQRHPDHPVSFSSMDIRLEQVSFGYHEETEILHNISLSIPAGTMTAFVGPSGSGKSTMGRVLCGLLKPDSGEAILDGVSVYASRAGRRNLQNKLSVVFQDYTTSANPRFRVKDIIGEGLTVRERRERGRLERNKETAALLELVGLPADFADRFPHELSGGQLQRVCIARAVACKPEVILFDEAISSLDAHTQVQVMDLLQDLKEKLGLTYVFITHDLTSITYLCDDVLFLYQGRVTEYLPVSRISETKDEYARRLLESIVVFDTETSEVAV